MAWTVHIWHKGWERAWPKQQSKIYLAINEIQMHIKAKQRRKTFDRCSWYVTAFWCGMAETLRWVSEKCWHRVCTSWKYLTRRDFVQIKIISKHCNMIYRKKTFHNNESDTTCYSARNTWWVHILRFAEPMDFNKLLKN